jgi:hypothetical protein
MPKKVPPAPLTIFLSACAQDRAGWGDREAVQYFPK